MTRDRVNWKGDEVKVKIMRATAAAVNETLAEAVAEAKNDHPGWQNRTGAAEGSVQIVEVAKPSGSAHDIAGRWGSRGIGYVVHLEFWYGSFLRNAADRTYGTLKQRIQRRLR